MSLSQYCECDAATYQLASRFNDDLIFAQEERRVREARLAKDHHFYANRRFAESCPVTVLAAYFAKFPGKATEKLFDGGSQYDRFRAVLLTRVVIDHASRTEFSRML
jgi:hypothetical protein